MTSHAGLYSKESQEMPVDILTHLGAHLPPSSINRYITSHIVTPLELALLRLLLAFYAFFTIFFSLGYESASTSPDENFSAEHFLSYFTNLCYWGLAFYYLFAGVHGLAYHFTQQQRPATAFWRYLELERWPRGLQAAHAVFYTSVVTFAPLVTIVFWAVIYKGPFFPLRFDAWKNISVHALNTLYALLLLLLPSTLPPPILHLPLLILILLLYLGLAYLTHAISHFYVYSFLDSETLGAGVVTGYCVGILAGVCVCFGAVWGVLWGKVWVVGARELRGRDRVGADDDGSIRREGAQGRAGMRRSGAGAGDAGGAAGGASDSVLGQPIRPPHTRSVSGVTAVNDDDQLQDLEMGHLDGSGRSSGAAGLHHDGVHHHHHSPRSPLTPVSPVSPTNTTRRGGGGAGAGEVIELDPVTSEFMRETALGRVKK